MYSTGLFETSLLMWIIIDKLMCVIEAFISVTLLIKVFCLNVWHFLIVWNGDKV